MSASIFYRSGASTPPRRRYSNEDANRVTIKLYQALDSYLQIQKDRRHDHHYYTCLPSSTSSAPSFRGPAGGRGGQYYTCESSRHFLRRTEVEEEWLQALEELAPMPNACYILASMLGTHFSQLGDPYDVARRMLDEVEEQHSPLLPDNMTTATTAQSRYSTTTTNELLSTYYSTCSIDNTASSHEDDELYVGADHGIAAYHYSEISSSSSSHHDHSDQCCTICLENYKDSKTEAGSTVAVRKLRCGHTFHAKCIEDWFNKRHITCPVCRYDISTEEQYQYHYGV